MKKHQTFQLLTAVLISGDVQNEGKQQLFKHRQKKKCQRDQGVNEEQQ